MDSARVISKGCKLNKLELIEMVKKKKSLNRSYVAKIKEGFHTTLGLEVTFLLDF